MTLPSIFRRSVSAREEETAARKQTVTSVLVTLIQKANAESYLNKYPGKGGGKYVSVPVDKWQEIVAYLSLLR